MIKTLCGKLELVMVGLLALFSLMQVFLLGWALRAYTDEREAMSEGFHSLTDSQVFRQAALLNLLCLFVVAWLGIRLFKLLTYRLKRLSSAMEGFQVSEFSEQTLVPQRFEQCQGDEVDRLAYIFNRMSCSLIERLEALKYQDALRRELVSHVSHDLRAPLANLHGYLETLALKGELMSPDDFHHCLQVALHQSERLRNLIQDLFDLARLDAHLTELRLEPFQLKELATDVLQEFDLTAQSLQARMNIESEPELPRVMGDVRLIERVLDNLIKNALQHMPPGGTLTIRLSSVNNGVQLEVSDTGSGIHPDDLPHIFERYYRSNLQSQPRSDGTGLGLTIARRILLMHQSDITVKSVWGEGATFRFWLSDHQA